MNRLPLSGSIEFDTHRGKTFCFFLHFYPKHPKMRNCFSWWIPTKGIHIQGHAENLKTFHAAFILDIFSLQKP